MRQLHIMLFGHQKMNDKAKEIAEKKAASSIYMRTVKDATPGSILQNLRKQINSFSKSKAEIDPYVLSTDDIQAILDDFSIIFQSMEKKYNRKGFYDDGAPNLTHAAHQVDGLWLYFVFSNYVHHWAAVSPDMKAKFEQIQSFDKEHFKIIAKILIQIEKSYHSLTTKPNVSDHQRILMIQGYLPEFIKRQTSSVEESLMHIRIAFPNKLIKSSQSIIAERDASSTSGIETSINAHLFESLSKDSIPDAFAPQKQNPQDSYVDDATGLELDFPLRGNITIETDGVEYHQGAFGRHNMVHTFKATIMRQSDWVRIPFNPSFDGAGDYTNATMLKRITDLMHIPFVHDFHLQYKQLLEIRRKVRIDLDLLQKKVLFKYTSLKEDERNYLSDLIRLDDELEKFIKKRHLESLLREPVQMYGFKKKEESLHFKQQMIAKNSSIQQLKLKEIEACRMLEEVNMQYKAALDQVLMTNERCSMLEYDLSAQQSSLTQEQARRAKHYAIYKELLSKPESLQNKMVLDEIIEFLKGIDTISIPNKERYINELKEKLKQAHTEQSKMQDALIAAEAHVKVCEASYSKAKEVVKNAEIGLAKFVERVLPLSKLRNLTQNLSAQYDQLKKPRILERDVLLPITDSKSESSYECSGASSSCIHSTSSSSKESSCLEFESEYQRNSFVCGSFDMEFLPEYLTELEEVKDKQACKGEDFIEDKQRGLLFSSGAIIDRKRKREKIENEDILMSVLSTFAQAPATKRRANSHSKGGSCPV